MNYLAGLMKISLFKNYQLRWEMKFFNTNIKGY